MKYRNLVPLSLLALLAACATAPAAPDCTHVGRDGQLCLLAPAQLPAVDAMHLVSIHRDGHDDTFMGRLQIDAHTLRLAGFSLFGTSLFNIEYDGHAIVSRPKSGELHADMLVLMLELALAEPAALQSRLHGLTLKLGRADHAQVRELFEHGHLIAHIERSDGALADAHINIAIPAIKLSVQMTPLSAAVNPP